MSSHLSHRSPHGHVIFTDLDGTEGVLVDLQARQYYQLNETASLIWRGLTNQTPINEIASAMTEIYDVTPEQARASIEAVIARFDAYRLLASA